MGPPDAGQETGEVRVVTDVASCESTFRQTLQSLDIDALDDVAAQPLGSDPAGAGTA